MWIQWRVLGARTKWSPMGRGAARPRTRSVLLFEQLEDRHALAGDIAVPTDVESLVAGDSVPGVESQLAPATPIANDPPPACDPVAGSSCDDDPVAGDPGTGGDPAPGGDPGAGGGDPGSVGGGVPGGPGSTVEEPVPNLMQPEIVVLDYEWTGNSITVYGQVIDDGPVGALFVEFGGLLANVTTFTDDDGWFSVTVQVGQNFGQVTAVVTDMEGWASDVATIEIL